MVTRPASRPYRLAAVVMAAAVIVVDTLAKLGPLGGWSAAFDVAANIALIIGVVTAIVIGERKDAVERKSEPDNDY